MISLFVCSTFKECFTNPVVGFQIPLSHLLCIGKEEINILFPHIKEKYLQQLKIQVVCEHPHQPIYYHWKFQARNTIVRKSRAAHSLFWPPVPESGDNEQSCKMSILLHRAKSPNQIYLKRNTKMATIYHLNLNIEMGGSRKRVHPSVRKSVSNLWPNNYHTAWAAEGHKGKSSMRLIFKAAIGCFYSKTNLFLCISFQCEVFFSKVYFCFRSI